MSHWDSRANECIVDDEAELKLAVAESKELAEATGQRSGDSASEKVAQ